MIYLKVMIQIGILAVFILIVRFFFGEKKND